jgi:hypothetical protein
MPHVNKVQKMVSKAFIVSVTKDSVEMVGPVHQFPVRLTHYICRIYIYINKYKYYLFKRFMLSA